MQRVTKSAVEVSRFADGTRSRDAVDIQERIQLLRRILDGVNHAWSVRGSKVNQLVSAAMPGSAWIPLQMAIITTWEI
jgi:hypothetical protein